MLVLFSLVWGDEDPPTPQAPAADAATAERQAKLEKKFQDTLTNATLDGRWYEIKDGKIGEEHAEKYTITRVTKFGTGTHWVILARVQYGDKDVSLPVPVRVEWADDTPVISVTNAGLPGLGTYTARVMVYDNLYAGTWSGTGHGGVLSGQVVSNSDKTSDKSNDPQTKAKK
jgi:hypothetical protein